MIPTDNSKILVTYLWLALSAAIILLVIRLFEYSPTNRYSGIP